MDKLIISLFAVMVGCGLFLGGSGRYGFGGKLLMLDEDGDCNK
jgi:hypothetical protein